VSEYAVTDPREKVGHGTFGGALAEAAFLLSLERNRHVLSILYNVPLLRHSVSSPHTLRLDALADLTIESFNYLR